MAQYKSDIVDVNLNTGNIHRSFLNHSIGQKDDDADRFGIRAFRDGVPQDLSGCSCHAWFTNSQGTTLALTSYGTVDGNEAYVTLPQACYDYNGQFCLAIKLVGGGISSTVRIVDGMVDNIDVGGAVSPTSEIPDYSDILAQYDAMVAATSAANTAIAETFNATKAYPTGKYVINEGALYRLTADHAANVTWANTSKVAAKIGDDLSDLKSALCGSNGFTLVDGWIPGAYRTGTGDTITPGSPVTSVTNYVCVYAECNQGDIFTIDIYNTATSNYRPWAFYNSSKTLIKKASSNSGRYSNVEVEAPENAAYFAVNAHDSNLPHIVYKGRIPDKRINDKQDKLTFDDVPTSGSNNPVKSNGIFVEVDELNNETKNTKSTLETINDIKIITDFQKSKGYDTSGTTVNIASPNDNKYLNCAYASCQEGDKFTYTGAASSNYRKYAFLDSLGNILEKGSGSGKVNNYVIVAPADSAYVVFNVSNASTYAIWKGTVIVHNAGEFIFKGANVAIIGDSISTNGNYSASNPLGNVPEIVVTDDDIGVELSAYVTYYDIGTTIGGHTIVESEVGTELTFTPVEGDTGKIIGKPKNNNESTTDVWWEVAMNALGFNPIPVCWSGSSITDHEENVQEDGHYIYKCAHSFHPSQIRKCGIRTPGSMERTAPDMIIIYRGTNDLSHSPYSRITDDLDSFPTTYPDSDTYDDGGTTRYSFVKGMRLLIKKLREAYPETKIVLCTMNYFRRLSTTAIYTNNGTDNWISYNTMIRRIADCESCDLIDFAKDGLTYWNAANGYYNEGTSSTAKWTHPNTKGQARLGSRALVDLRKVNDMTVPSD